MTALRGLDALEDAINAIAENPLGHKQSAWRCKTGMCLAGYIAERNGSTWLSDASEPESHWLVPLPGETPVPLAYGKHGVHVGDRARSILGFYPDIGDGADDLFGGANTLADLRDMLSSLRAAEAAGTLSDHVDFLPEVPE